MDDTSMRDLTRVFGALGDETRLRILGVLGRRECCVGEVEQALEICQSRASRNLAILRDADLIRARREGAWVVYSVNQGWPLARNLAETVAAALAESPMATKDAHCLKQASRYRQQRPAVAEPVS